MKKLLIISVLLSFAVSHVFCQPVKAMIKLKDGKTIDAYHFGKLKCESNAYAATFTVLKGKFNGSHTEINDFKDVAKLSFAGFSAAPVPSVGNQKGKITVYKTNGVNVTLDDAELVMSCFNPSDKYNEIHVQVINPLTEAKTDVTVEMRKIESITF